MSVAHSVGLDDYHLVIPETGSLRVGVTARWQRWQALPAPRQKSRALAPYESRRIFHLVKRGTVSYTALLETLKDRPGAIFVRSGSGGEDTAAV